MADLSITFERPDGTVDRLNDTIATLVVRPRGLHMTERHVEVDGRSPSRVAVRRDACWPTTRRPAFAARGSGLYLYLPKMESHHEAEWWDAVLSDLERRVGLPYASIRVTVLIETILGAFEMEEILYALRDRITGLNAGRWDYIFSVIKKFGHDPAHVLPDRSQVTMTVPFMAAYAERLVAVCHAPRRPRHRRHVGVHPQPAQARRDRAGARRGAGRQGARGRPGLRRHVGGPPRPGAGGHRRCSTPCWATAPNQLEVRPPLADDVSGLLATDIPGGAITRRRRCATT